uniref:Sodium/solute symporter n=1 Tax=Chromera velia CCMP2878 TaxID=1169474 RepID=A0A0G4I604_9ALVE|eukprot:Cvel_55.t1-p1 / transcript=Cvel_55.t1 / gene=Cvel_55 / organism=Chromera_velia_CCMP2878 / gene_product=Sodium/glucose cotransporter 4, putative / transcript_product=Sodium/glucose cotransporter 4, putative / location=Cvel_scaffold6:23899-26665(-) / protein_length=852 / sequence_SO=supercontig / SO=protein_coding / is_pseudo=false
MEFAWLDYVVFAVVVLAFAVIMWLSARNRARAKSTDEYFLTCRSMSWWTIGFSLYASNIGTEHLVGQAGAAVATGLGVASYDIAAGTLVILLGFLYYPVYRAAGVSTVPEYFEKRFNPLCRYLLVGYSLVSWVMVRVAAPLFGAAVIFDVLLKIDMWVSSVVVVLVTVVYGLFGGLAAVMYTDVLQAGIFTTAALMGLVVVFRVFPGGLPELQGTLAAAGQTDFFHIMRPWDDQTYPWAGLLFGSAFVSTWYWNADQVMVQRVLASKSLFDAQTGVIVGALLKTVTAFAINLPGMAARGLYETCVHSGGSMFEEWCAPSLAGGSGVDRAYPLLVARHFPSGLLGLVVCGWIAALMSSLDSVLNSSGHLVAHDFWKRAVRRSASDRELMWVGRGTVVLVAGVALGWLPMIVRGGGAFYLFTQTAMSHVAPAIGAVLILGVLVPSRRWCNGAGAGGGLLFGMLFGVARFVVHMGAREECDAKIVNNRIKGPWFECMNLNNFALASGFLSFFVTVLVSVCVDMFPCLSESWRERLRGAPGGLGGLTIWSVPLVKLESEDADRHENEKAAACKRKRGLGKGKREGVEKEGGVQGTKPAHIDMERGMCVEERKCERRGASEGNVGRASRAETDREALKREGVIGGMIEEGGSSVSAALHADLSTSTLALPPSPPPLLPAEERPEEQHQSRVQHKTASCVCSAPPIMASSDRSPPESLLRKGASGFCETDAEGAGVCVPVPGGSAGGEFFFEEVEEEGENRGAGISPLEGNSGGGREEGKVPVGKTMEMSIDERNESTVVVQKKRGVGRRRLVLLSAAVCVVVSRYVLLFTLISWSAFPLNKAGPPVWEGRAAGGGIE